MKVSILKKITIVVCCGWLVGCVVVDPKPNDPAYAPVTPKSLIPPPAKGGGLFNAGYGLSLYENHTAHRVGDIITVLLSESTTAKKASGSNFTKDNDSTVTAPIVFGKNPQFNVPGVVGNVLDSTHNLDLSASLSAEREFKGSSDNSQSNNLSGTITVTVTEVLPNGVLIVRGEKWLTLNTGDEYVRISGMVRPEDVSPDNTVYSATMADARIIYSGTGASADANQVGWLSKFFNGKYFPF